MDLLKSKLIDADLKKIVEPLETERVDTVQISGESGTDRITESIESSDREFFQLEPAQITTKETEIIGRLVSLNKERERGTFKLRNNRTVSYHFIGDDKEQFHSDFSRDGQVKARVVAELNEDLEPVHLNIKSVQPIQGTLQLTAPDTE